MMKRKILSLGLAVALVLGLAAPALAYETPDFSDVPPTHWAYEAVMKMADAGVIKGTGNGQFSPEDKLTAEMFVVLVGRVVFPEVKAEGADWSGPYVAEAKAQGLLTGTNVTDSSLKGEISRYDMAVILAKCVEILKVSASKADTSKVADYGDVPNRYTDAVLMAYGSGLIRGDQAGSFNGQNSMTRQEAATVIDRLLGLKGNSQGGTIDSGTTTESETPTESAYTLEVQTNTEIGSIVVPGDKIGVSCRVLPSAEAAPYAYDDRAGFTCVSDNPSVAEVTGTTGWLWYVTAHREGTATITVTDPYGVTGSKSLTVISAREGLGAKTFTLDIRNARRETHTLRGDAYTELDFIYSIPYKLYYTRDGGKTSQLVYEGITPSQDGSSAGRVTVKLPEDAFYSQDAGVYISAEAVLDGQRLVTSDLRTDGRAYPSTVRLLDGERINDMYIKLTPPTGEKARFTIKGAVVYRPSGATTNLRVGAGFIVQLHFKDGRVLAETTTDANGAYSLDCEVDAIDNGFDPNVEQYYVTASGVQNDVFMETSIPAGKTQLIRSLNILGGNPYNQTNTGTFWSILVSEK